MKSVVNLLGLFFILALANSLLAQNHASKILFDLNLENDSVRVQAQDASCEVVSYLNKKALKVNSGYSIKEPGVKLLDTPKNSWDLSLYYTVEADVSNVGDESMQVELFVGNDLDGLVRWFCSDYVDLAPGESKTIKVPLAWTSWIHSPQLDIVAMRGVPGKLKMDLSSIHELNFNARYSTSVTEFVITQVRAVGLLEKRDTAGFFPFVDIYGQYKHKDWHNKIHSDKEFKVLDKTESKEFKKYPQPANRSKYGGWTAGPKLKSTGFFRTEKYQDKWWLVDPEGYLFLTVGLNCVNLSGNTGIEGRSYYFENLPDTRGEMASFYGKSSWATHGFYKDKTPFVTYNFYESNLYRKFGDDWYNTFMERAHQRIKSWGMNTIGFVSDQGLVMQQKTPYVGSVWINGTPKIEASNGYWGQFYDVFDPEFRAIVKQSIERQKLGANDPWCIGYFVDNEMSWGKEGSLSEAVLKSPASQAAKQEFVKDLKVKYKSIKALNGVWISNYSSWDDLLEQTQAPKFEHAEEDCLVFYEKIANTYFSIVSQELKKVAPNQNYFGCRFAWKNNISTMSAAAKYCDIISFNKYEYSVENVALPEGIDMPILIGEFHFGSTDRGLSHPGVRTAIDQKDRGLKYQEYMQGAFRNPNIVGAHWFQYRDQPLTGRGDGENNNVGFIDITDNPFEELIEKVRETTYTMYEYRYHNSNE